MRRVFCLLTILLPLNGDITVDCLLCLDMAGVNVCDLVSARPVEPEYPCPYCPSDFSNGGSLRAHLSRYHRIESNANKTWSRGTPILNPTLEYCGLCKLLTLKATGSSRTHDLSFCHKSNLASGVHEHDAMEHGDGDEGFSLSDGYCGEESGDEELDQGDVGAASRHSHPRYDGIIQAVRNGLHSVPGVQGHGLLMLNTGNVEVDWLGRRDRISGKVYPTGEVFLLPVNTPAFWKYAPGDDTYHREFLDEPFADWTTYVRCRILGLRELVFMNISLTDINSFLYEGLTWYRYPRYGRKTQSRSSL